VVEIPQLLQKSEELTDWIRSTLNNLEVVWQERSILSFGCLDLAIEHREGIVLLITQGLCGPAFALVRSVFESYIRGIWLRRCAKGSDIEAFKRDKFNKKFEDLIIDIERIEEFKHGILLRLKNQAWKIMNSYTHSGIQHVLRRIKSDTLQPNYDKGAIEEALNCTNALALLSLLEIAILSTNLGCLKVASRAQFSCPGFGPR
jgi:hypothetical protein